LISLFPDEDMVNERYRGVSGDNYSGDEELLKVLEDITPDYKNLIDKLEAIQIKTSEVKALHELYLIASNQQYTGFVKLAEGIKQEDDQLVVEANAMIDESSKGMSNFFDRLNEIQLEHLDLD
jgi:hypothetical protein